jgi:hypothetical protein
VDLSKYPYVAPRTVYEGKDFVQNEDPGLSLLDYFAGAVLPEVLRAHVEANKGQVNPFSIGMMCYALALGMLAAREQPEEAFQPKEAPPAEEAPPKGEPGG